ncbi:glutamate receptor ionotropic, kainate 2-like isoform X2 [Paramacrobiotus metropolitanus]|uniref:glutamate receptor ionotropic, kainate 2-like isoform X2 n=1 Tax=Paramacrobiotus metropolitanus TaxID=2943436 RepID=UPI00244590B8|nr:glutamate receptor ionotropic, kainate 2-like isoform X2 [Paramacrobiotus metropolitanus]
MVLQIAAGIFDKKADSLQAYNAFKYAIQTLNDGRKAAALPNTKFVSKDIREFQADLITGPSQICELLREKIAAIFGPQRRLSTALVQSISNSTSVPHFSVRYSPSENLNSKMTINMYPDHWTVSKALVDLIGYFNWTTFALVYDDAESLIRASGILNGMYDLKPKLYKLNASNISATLMDVKASGISFFVLDLPAKQALQVLRAAKTLDMVDYYFHYILTASDIHLLDLNDIFSTHVNITALQLVDFDDIHVAKAAKAWGAPLMEGQYGKIGVTTEAALLHDAVMVFAKALRKLDAVVDVTPASVNCDDARPWIQGGEIYNQILTTKIKGLSGDVMFESSGLRSSVRLHIVEPLRYGLQKVGQWTAEQGVRIMFNYTGQREFVQSSIKNKVLKVLTKLERPYVMEMANASLLSGNKRYRGFCVDMLDNISRTLNFSYELIVSNLPYGDQDPVTKEWNGLIRELIDKRGDMVLGAMTITTEREEVVDFSQPFLYLGVRILLRKPEGSPKTLFSFLVPLSLEVWIYILIAYIATSGVMFIIGRFSPYEWYNPNPCVEEAGVVENQFSIFNAMWFTIGSLMQEGTEVAPRAISTRFLAGIWWFFTMVMVSSYTANLAAYLTAERMKLPIENAHDLVKQNQIKYGCLEGGATCNFFKNSVYPDYVRMWDAIKADPKNNLVQSHDEGIAKVKKPEGMKGYAYLMESITLDYITSRDCNLTGIGNPLDTKGYGVAFPKNSPFREEISVIILTQQDKGYLEEFRIKWWKQEDGGDTCHEAAPLSGTSAMGLDMVGGVFVVVLLGVLLGIVVAVLEFVWKAKKNPDEYKEPIMKEAFKSIAEAIRSPHARAKTLLRAATPGQLREEVMSAAVPMLPNRRNAVI